MKVNVQRTGIVAAMAVLFVAIGGFFDANARPIYARNENKKCIYCHVRPGGGERGFRGIYYKLHGHSFKGFVEKVEAARAGVRPNSTGEATRPTKSYPPPGDTD